MSKAIEITDSRTFFRWTRDPIFHSFTWDNDTTETNLSGHRVVAISTETAQT